MLDLDNGVLPLTFWEFVKLLKKAGKPDAVLGMDFETLKKSADPKYGPDSTVYPLPTLKDLGKNKNLGTKDDSIDCLNFDS